VITSPTARTFLAALRSVFETSRRYHRHPDLEVPEDRAPTSSGTIWSVLDPTLSTATENRLSFLSLALALAIVTLALAAARREGRYHVVEWCAAVTAAFIVLNRPGSAARKTSATARVEVRRLSRRGDATRISARPRRIWYEAFAGAAWSRVSPDAPAPITEPPPSRCPGLRPLNGLRRGGRPPGGDWGADAAWRARLSQIRLMLKIGRPL
jgi:hypothetical protein